MTFQQVELTKRTRNPKASQQIIDLLKANAGLNANQVAQKVNITPNSAKATLNRLTKMNQVARVKQELADKPKVGPKSIYVYSAV